MNGPKYYCENAALLPKSNIPYSRWRGRQRRQEKPFANSGASAKGGQLCRKKPPGVVTTRGGWVTLPSSCHADGADRRGVSRVFERQKIRADPC